MTVASLPVRWRRRLRPLAPRVALGVGAVGRALARRAKQRADRLEVCPFEGAIAFLGAAGDLPWADGVVYLGAEPSAAGLFLPTHREPTVPAEILARALRGRSGSGPMAVLHDPPRLLCLEGARAFEPDWLDFWLEEAAGG